MRKYLSGFLIGLVLAACISAGAVVFKMPADIRPDNVGMYGLFGFMQNTNNAVLGSQSTITTAGTSGVVTVPQLMTGVIGLAAGASGGFTTTLPSTASIIAGFGGTAPTDGTYSKLILIKNIAVGQTSTLTAGDGNTTMIGTLTIATSTTRTFLLTILTPTTISVENYGTQSL
jgi:hypothetical protein